MSIKLNVKAWTLRQYRDFTIAIKENDFDKIISLCSQVITEWSFKGDPANVDFWLDGLNLGDWLNIAQEISKQIQAQTDPKN
jgi:hypothetical protein